jgi:hypothetical protein
MFYHNTMFYKVRQKTLSVILRKFMYLIGGMSYIGR